MHIYMNSPPPQLITSSILLSSFFWRSFFLLQRETRPRFFSLYHSLPAPPFALHKKKGKNLRIQSSISSLANSIHCFCSPFLVATILKIYLVLARYTAEFIHASEERRMDETMSEGAEREGLQGFQLLLRKKVR